MTRATAPEKTQGWRRLSDFSRPGFNTSLCTRGAALALFLGARVRRVVDLGQVLEIEVGVNLRRRNACVPQHFLYCAQIAARLQHVRGERMPQHMRMDIARYSAL